MNDQNKEKSDVIHEQAIIIPASESQLKNLNMNSPEDIVKVSKEIAKYVKSNALSVKIQNKPYVMVEGWQFTAGLLGLVGMVEECKNESSYKEVTYEWKVRGQGGAVYEKSHKTKEFKYVARAVFKNPITGVIVGQGFAMCTNEEQKKHTFDEFAIMSHAQTRAIGKAARMAFAFIIKAAGYQPTPAEEMEGADNEPETVKSLVPEDIIEKISNFKDVDKLITWAGSEDMSSYHSNPQFRSLVSIRKAEILKGKTDGKQ